MNDDVPEDYADVMERVWKRYETRVTAILNHMRDVLISVGFDVTEPYDMSDDCFRWNMGTKVDGAVGDGSIDFCVEMAEASDYGDNTEEQPYGINFGINIVEWGGLILGGLMPYNFTEWCWVDALNADAVEARFKLLEEADPWSILTVLPEDARR